MQIDYLYIFTQNFIYGGILTFLICIPTIKLLYKLNLTDFKWLKKGIDNTLFFNLHKHKIGTPSSGGLAIFASFLLFLAFGPFWIGSMRIDLFLVSLVFASLGFYYDATKLLIKKGLLQKELRARYELFLIFLVSFSFSLYFIQKYNLALINFTGAPIQVSTVFIVIFITLFFACTATGLNITDGLDGLLPGTSFIANLALTILAFMQGQYDLFGVLSFLAGAQLAFLYFNINPARVFLGDIGSNFIAGVMAYSAIRLNAYLPVIMILGLFYIELFSSVSQQIALKMGKRIFKIAPIHHTFEAEGWSETKIVFRFWLFGVALAVLGLYTFATLY